MNKRFLVSLKPLDSYFFSGQETFNFSNGEKKEKGSYFVKSKKFPQQTTLLGVIRKELLIIAGEYRENRKDYSENFKEVIKIIGDGSFTTNKENKNINGFGKIKSISSVYLYNGENIFTNSPLDYGLKYKKNKEGQVFLNSKKEFIINLENYKMKDGLNERIISFNPNEIIYKYEDIFEKDERIGIKVKKNKDNKKNEDGYYRQLNYRLKNNFEFCFFLELDLEEEEKIGTTLKKSYTNIIYMGGESRPFKLEIKEINNDKYNMENLEINDERIVCIGDILLEQNAYKKIQNYADFILGKTEFFKNYVVGYDAKEKEVKPYLLLKRGSVIYCNSAENRKKIRKIINKKHIQVIGYNHISGGDKE